MAHFRQAHHELRDTDTSMAELGFHSANAIVEQIVDRLRDEEDNGFYDLPPVYAAPSPSVIPTAAPPPPPPPTPPILSTQQQANSVVPADPNTAVLQAMMNNMQMMHDNMHQNYYQGRGRGRGRGSARGRGRGRGGNRNRSQQTSNYCHTHGNCAHASRDCNTPGDTHQNDATFANMMGGSQNRCFWLNQ